MALCASAIPSTLIYTNRVKFLDGKRYPVPKYSGFSGFHNHQTSRARSVEVLAMAQFSEPGKLITHVKNFRDRLWEVFPEPVKQFPMKKAEEMILQRLLFLGEKALKWSLITLFILSFSSDVMISILRNKELIIPFGLSVGFMMANFLKEVSLELLQISREGDLSKHLLGISFIFVLVKVASVYFALGGQVFLSHVGNGGLLQVLWLWKKLQEEREASEKEKSSLLQNTSFSSNVED